MNDPSTVSDLLNDHSCYVEGTFRRNMTQSDMLRHASELIRNSKNEDVGEIFARWRFLLVIVNGSVGTDGINTGSSCCFSSSKNNNSYSNSGSRSSKSVCSSSDGGSPLQSISGFDQLHQMTNGQLQELQSQLGIFGPPLQSLLGASICTIALQRGAPLPRSRSAKDLRASLAIID